MSRLSGKTKALLAILNLFGLGVFVHDYAHQVWQLKGYHNLVEGGYVGLALMAPYLMHLYIPPLMEVKNKIAQRLR